MKKLIEVTLAVVLTLTCSACFTITEQTAPTDVPIETKEISLVKNQTIIFLFSTMSPDDLKVMQEYGWVVAEDVDNPDVPADCALHKYIDFYYSKCKYDQTVNPIPMVSDVSIVYLDLTTMTFRSGGFFEERR